MKKLLIVMSLLLLTGCNLSPEIYTASFESNGGSTVNDMAIEEGSGFLPPVQPEKLGYEFDGWYTDETFTEEYSFTTIVEGDVNLYAKWNPVQYAFHKDYGYEDESETVMIYFEDALDLTVPDRPGYEFVGWYTDPTRETPFEGETMPADDLGIFGMWVPTLFRFTLVVLEESDWAMIAPGSEFTLLAPEEPNYTFEGWFTDPEFTTPFTYTEMPSMDITGYAKMVLTSCDEGFILTEVAPDEFACVEE